MACRGPVLSVKLHFRVPPAEVRRLALDEGSRTSAALSRVLLAEMYDIRPKWESLPIGCGLDTTDADAVLLIGDRAIGEQRGAGPRAGISSKFGISARWCDWTGLPFVFAMWIARADAEVGEVAAVLGAARDEGVAALAEIAEREGPLLGFTSWRLVIFGIICTLHWVDEGRRCGGFMRCA